MLWWWASYGASLAQRRIQFRAVGLAQQNQFRHFSFMHALAAGSVETEHDYYNKQGTSDNSSIRYL